MIWMPAKPLRAQTSCRWASSHSVPHFFCKDVSSSSIVMVLKEGDIFQNWNKPQILSQQENHAVLGEECRNLNSFCTNQQFEYVCVSIWYVIMCVCLSGTTLCVYVCAHMWGNGNHVQSFERAARALNRWTISKSFTFSFTVTVFTSLLLIQQVFSHLTCLLLSICTLFKGERN